MGQMRLRCPMIASTDPPLLPDIRVIQHRQTRTWSATSAAKILVIDRTSPFGVLARADTVPVVVHPDREQRVRVHHAATLADASIRGSSLGSSRPACSSSAA